MIIDCSACTVRGDACSQCLVSVVLGAPPEGIEIDDTERRALAALAAGGMVPELRLTVSVPDAMPGRCGPRPGGARPGSEQVFAAGLPASKGAAGTRRSRRAAG